MRILITGASGFLGSSIVIGLNDPKYALHVISRSSSKLFSQENIYKFNQIDLSSHQDLTEVCKDVDVIIHAAGMNANDSTKDPSKANFFNGTVTSNLLNHAIDSKVKRFIFLSTAHVYKSPLDGMIQETDQLTNPHPYATSHVFGENVVLEASKNSLIDGLVLRISNVFGSPEIENSNCWDLFINNLCMQAFIQHELKITGNPFQERDFIAKSDLISVLIDLINYPYSYSPNHIVNIGSGVSYSLIDMANLIKDEYEKMYKFNINISTNTDIKYGKYKELLFSSKLDHFFNIKMPNSSIYELGNLLHFCESKFGK